MISSNTYTAIVGVSPMIECGEEKDQDRAVWFPRSQTAGLADGVSNSPNSKDAATIMTEYCPTLYVGDPEKKLRAVCDLLELKRQERMASEIKVPSHIPEHMKELLVEASRQKLAESYQTTFVSVKLEPDNETVKTKTFRCGDSILSVFSSDGKFIASSPPISKQVQGKHNKDIIFRPGDELLAKVEGGLSESIEAHHLDISKEYRCNWLVCSPVDLCKNGGDDLSDGMRINYGGKLIVPKYLAGHAVRAGDAGYISIPYSRTIRLLSDKRTFQDKAKFHSGSYTEVLPDHFYTGQWVYFEDEFPAGSHFILASDGFTECFNTPLQMWSWLNRYKNYLKDDNKKRLLLKRLHLIRQKKKGDDDISFVWMFPEDCEVNDDNAK